MNQITPREAIDEIVEWTLTYYDDKKGGLPRSVRYDGTTSKERLYNDLGDYLPFFAYLGKKDFCLKQLEDTKNILQPNGLLPPEFRYLGLPCTRSYEHTDLLLGLIDTHEHFPSPELKELIQHVSSGVIQAFHPQHKKPSSWFFPSINYRLPIFDFKDGMFIEVWTVLAKKFSDPHFLETAKQLTNSIQTLSPKFFFPLVPNITGTSLIGKAIAYFKFRSALSRYTPMKYLSNTIYAFLELYNATKDESHKQLLYAVKRKIEEQLLDKEGVVHECRCENQKLTHIPQAYLVQNFPIMDWAADCAYFLKDNSFLDLAKKIAEPWLAQQDTNTGLIPEKYNGSSTDLDTLTDTSIAFIKIAEISGEERYRIAGERMIQGILCHHRQPKHKGYALSVEVKTGAVINPELKIKFICLFLKALIVLDEKRSIYKTELYELIKDR